MDRDGRWVMKIYEAEYNYWIQMGDSFIRQRRHLRSATEDPMKPMDDMVCALCKRILELEKENKIIRGEGDQFPER